MTTMADHGYSSWLEQELRSDQAGETGAVWIYKGILATQPKPALRAFCRRHLETELRHLEQMNNLLAPAQRSALLPLWRVAGFLTGFLPGCVSEQAVYLTIAAVETFVQEHYLQQIEHPALKEYPDLRCVLENCMKDEIDHKEEASALTGASHGKLAACWSALVGAGSLIAVDFARRF
jgi:3-demethoxyubiquinol 3-hydroxylase